MTNVRDLAEKRVVLQTALSAIAMTNIYGRTTEELISLEVRHIETLRDLRIINAKIAAYVEGTDEP